MNRNDMNRNDEIRPLADDELDIVAGGSLQSLINAGITYLAVGAAISFYANGGGVGRLIGNGLH
jgi:hypothetical protein